MSSVPEFNALPQAPVSSEAQAKWFAIHTQCRHEQSVARQLSQKQIAAFVPVMRETHNWSDRRKTVEVPLFPCYVFVQASGWRELHLDVIRTRGVFQWVGTRGVPEEIPEAQIEAVRSMISNRLNVTPYPFLSIGQRVRVRGGSLDGVEGFLVRKNEKDARLVISIEMLQQSVSVALDGYQVEAA